MSRVPLLFLIAAVGVLLAGAARTVVSGGHVFVRADRAAAECGATFRGRGKDFSISKGGQTIRFTARKREANASGVLVAQSFSPLWKNGRCFLSSADLTGVVRPLLLPSSAVVKHRVWRVVLDPGHGGRDRGASGRISCEKNLTLALCYRVRTILRRCGFDVRLTRYKDRWISLPDRVRNLRRRGADLFVSVHANSAADRRIAGIETFCLAPAGTPSSNSGKPVKVKYPGNRLDGNNLLLAYSIQKSLLRRTRAKDLGVKRSRFSVLRNADVPAVLIEVGFLSNRAEERRLNTAAYREQLARGIAAGIIDDQRALPVKR